MKNIRNYLNKNELNEGLLFEMSNVASKRTGLSHSVWLDDAAASRDIQHSKYRIKYGNNIYSSVIIKFFNNPVTENDVIGDVKNLYLKDIAKAIEWVNLNRDILINTIILKTIICMILVIL